MVSPDSRVTSVNLAWKGFPDDFARGAGDTLPDAIPCAGEEFRKQKNIAAEAKRQRAPGPGCHITLSLEHP